MRKELEDLEEYVKMHIKDFDIKFALIKIIQKLDEALPIDKSDDD